LDIASVPGLRPTSERIRETLFNWLAPHIAGARCLDLFAGTGALGLEALSRGAASATFVERSKRAATTLRHNVEALETEGATVLEVDAYDFLSEKGRNPGRQLVIENLADRWRLVDCTCKQLRAIRNLEICYDIVQLGSITR
jgi:16S rRNA (guanine966-N2)-methyltransferase